MEKHPLAELFPEMPKEQFASFKADIKDHGQRLPITIYEGKILDGVNRERACQELGIKLKTEIYEDDDPLGFVISQNIQRRHLDKSQKALIGARFATMKNGRPDQNHKLVNGFPIPEIAGKFGIAKPMITWGKQILEKGTPELIRSVELGIVTVKAAKDLASLSNASQVSIIHEKDKKKQKQKIREAKEKAKKHRKEEQNRPALILTRPQKGKLDYYTVENWKKLDKLQMRDLIEQGFESKALMNEQMSTAIDYALYSHNLVTGCLHDCPYCYARDIANKWFKYGFVPVFHPARLAAPGNTQIPTNTNPAFHNIFANSMSDLFGKWVPNEWIEAAIEMARRNPKWNFLTLTKFPIKAADFDFPNNWWMGTTVDAQCRVANAEKAFAKIKCGTKWLSVEPMLQPLKFQRLDLFQWIVIGGASKSTKTPALYPPFDWILDLCKDAREAGLKIYHKTNLGIEDTTRLMEFPWSKTKRYELPKAFRYLKDLGG